MKLQRTTFRSRQRGLSFISLIFVGFLAVATFAIGGQSIPIFLEYQAIRKAALKASKEGSTVGEIQAAFDRAGAMRQHQFHFWQGPGDHQTRRQNHCESEVLSRD